MIWHSNAAPAGTHDFAGTSITKELFVMNLYPLTDIYLSDYRWPSMGNGCAPFPLTDVMLSFRQPTRCVADKLSGSGCCGVKGPGYLKVFPDEMHLKCSEAGRRVERQGHSHSSACFVRVCMCWLRASTVRIIINPIKPKKSRKVTDQRNVVPQ